MSRSSRAAAVLVAALFLLPLAPVAAASGECGGAPCADLTLYPHPDKSLTTLVGDDVAQSLSTGPLTTATAPLAVPMTFAKQGAFRVHITSGLPNTTSVVGNVTVFAQDLLGHRHTLARRDYTASNASTPAGPLAPTLAAIDSGVNDSISELNASPASLILDTVHVRACALNSVLEATCSATSGSPAFGAYRPCDPTDPGGGVVNLPRLIWAATQTADAALREQAGVGVCGHNAWNDSAPYAAQADEQVADSFDALPAYPGLGSLAEGDGTSPFGDAWGAIELNATAPVWFPQDPTSFALPSGYALGFEIALRTSATTPFGTSPGPYMIVQYGHNGAPTRLEVRTAVPLPFGALTGPTPTIGEGTHTGFLETPIEIDHYGFEAPANSVIEIRSNWTGMGTNYTLFSPDGTARAGPRIDAPAEPGRWTLRATRGNIENNYPLSPEYSFTLTFSEPSDDGVRIEEGVHEGALGDGNDVDTYTFFAWHGQRVDVALAHGDGAEFTLGVGNSFWDVVEGNDSFTGRPRSTGVWEIRVSRVYGSCPYTLTLDLNDAENHTILPTFATVASGDEFRYVGEMKGHGTGVDVRSNGTLYHVRPNETTVLLTNSINVAIGRTSDGRFLDLDPTAQAVALRGPGGTVPIAAAWDGRFGPDAYYGHNDAGFKRVTADRVETSIAFGGWGPPSVLPNGTVIASDLSGMRSMHVLDFEARTAMRAPQYDRLIAFDLAGNGYFIANNTLVVRRDAGTLAHDVVARADTRIYDLAFSTDALYTHSDTDPGAGPGAILRVPFAGGFAGFEPTFDIAPAADLVPVNATDEIVGYTLVDSGGSVSVAEEHRTRVTIENRGGSLAHASLTRWSVYGGLSVVSVGWGGSAITPAIAGGGSAVVEITWRADLPLSPGDKRAVVDVDAFHNVTESDKTNNRLEFSTHVVVGGNHAACVAALDALPAPWPLPFNAEALCPRQT